MEADVSLSRDQPVPMLDLPISFPNVSLTDLNEYDTDETMIFDNLSLHDLEETNAETNKMYTGISDLQPEGMSPTKWFEIDLDKGKRDNNYHETATSISFENVGSEVTEQISTQTDHVTADRDEQFELKDFKPFQSKYIKKLYTIEKSASEKQNTNEDVIINQCDQSFEKDQRLDSFKDGIEKDQTLSLIDQRIETDSVLETRNVNILDNVTINMNHCSVDCTSGTCGESETQGKPCLISNDFDKNGTKIQSRSRKRKQNKPTMIMQGESDYGDSSDYEIDSEWLFVQKKPLFSKLCVPKKTPCFRTQVKGDNSLSRCDIIEIIEDSLRSFNEPVSTNRYRRHFIKTSQKVLSMQSRLSESCESQTNAIPSEIKDISGVKTPAGLLDEKTSTVEEKEPRKDGPFECSLCGKHFNTLVTISAHYECHKSIDKDFENTHCLSLIKSDHVNGCIQDGIEADKESSESEDESIASSGVDSEQSGNRSKEHHDSDILETSTYFCQVCQKRFTNISALQNHMQDHSLDGDPESENEAKGDHYCAICQKNFASAGSLHVHNKIHSGDNPYRCPTCNKSFRDKTRLTTHIRVHTGEKPFLCSICQKSFSQKGNLKLHQKIHTGERNCICQVCGNGFRSRSDLVRHMKVHGLALSSGSENDEATPKTPVVMTMSSPLRLQHESHDVHTKFHRSNKIKDLLEASDNIAPIAPALQGVKNMNDLLRLGVSSSPRRRPSQDGLEGYHRNDPFSDKLVPKFPGLDANTYLMNLNREVEFIKAMTEAKMRSEAASMKSYVCPLCGLTLTSFDAFNHHVLLQHNPLTTFGPPIPNTAFGPTKASPNKHPSPSIFSLLDPFLSVPKTDKFKCKDCNEVFHTDEDLSVHSKTHRTKSAAIKTPIISRDNGVGSFLSSTAMMEDMKFSATEKVYSCEFCGKTFRRSHHLQTHMRTHTGDRPYTCVECNKCFARGDHLQNHRRTHTGEKPYHCDICNRSYSQSHHLLRHKRTHTGERPYHCNLCEKTFSRDHHLKKHLETHRGITDNLSGQIDSKTEKEVSRILPEVSFNMTTRSTNRIGQLMMDMQSENSASKLMESMIKRHLKEEEERKLTKYESHDKTTTDSEDLQRKKETLKITDILNDEIDKHMPSHISTNLILDHVMRLTRHKPEGKFTQPVDHSIKQKEDTITTEEATSQRIFTRAGYQDSLYSDLSIPSHSSHREFREKKIKTTYSNSSIEAKQIELREGMKREILNYDFKVHRSDLESKGIANKLEPQTLDDIVLKSLHEEYNIKHI